MANTPQARKRARQSEVRRQRNASQRSAMRTAIKRVNAALATGDYEQANSAYAAAVSVLDSAASHGIMHKNKAARHKSRLNAQVVALKP